MQHHTHSWSKQHYRTSCHWHERPPLFCIETKCKVKSCQPMSYHQYPESKDSTTSHWDNPHIIQHGLGNENAHWQKLVERGCTGKFRPLRRAHRYKPSMLNKTVHSSHE